MATSQAEMRFFKPRIRGPEQLIENAVLHQFRDIFDRNDWPLWMGGSVPIGAGYPDIVSVWYDPQVMTLADFPALDGHILAYLRSVRHASAETIAQRLRSCSDVIEARMIELSETAVVKKKSANAFAISSVWRRILPEVVTVEAKVSDWQSALRQATRNQIFAHRSFVALPYSVAIRVAERSEFDLQGVGVIAVGECGDVQVIRGARKNRPSVWNYYFHLAAIAAKDLHSREKR